MNKFIERLVRLGATVGTYGAVATAFAAALCANPASAPVLVVFMASVGGNLIANILDRAAQGEDSTDEEITAALQELKAIGETNATLLEEFGARFKADIEAGLEELTQMRTESANAHAEMSDDIAGARVEMADGFDRVVREVRNALHRDGPPAPTSAEQREILLAYAERVVNSPRYTRMSTGGLTAESPTVQDSVREPHLDDIFVEPNLAGAGSRRESTQRVSDLLGILADDEAGSYDQDQDHAREMLLRMQVETWEEIRRGGQSKKASDALRDKQAVVILGDPGSGKSTLLRWLAVEQAKLLVNGDQGPIPIFTAIGDYANAWKARHSVRKRLSLQSYLSQQIDSEYGGMEGVYSKALAVDGRGILLLLDGFDEIPRHLRRSVTLEIQDFIAFHTQSRRKTRVVVSSRFFGYEEAPIPSPAVQLIVMPFDDSQIKAFAGKWYMWLEKLLRRERANESEAGRHARRFEESVFARPQITELARNPLMLTMIAVVVRQGKRLPERRVELYDLTLRQLMTQWEYLRGDSTWTRGFKVDYSEACQLWSPIARWMHEVGTGAVREVELRQRLYQRIEELELDHKAEEWLTVRGDKCCLLQERGAHIFGFLHQTFQEYLAAMDILHDGQFVDELPRYIEDPRWHEVLRLACGYLGVVCVPPKKKEVTGLLRHILDNGSRFEHLVHRDLFLAASCIADDVKPSKETEQEIVTRLLRVAGSKEMDPTCEEAMRWAVANARVQMNESILQSVESDLVRHWGSRNLPLFTWFVARPGPVPSEIRYPAYDLDNGDRHCLRVALRWYAERSEEHLAQLLLLRRSRSSRGEDIRSHLAYDDYDLLKCEYSRDSLVRLEAAKLLLGTPRCTEASRVLLSLLADSAEEVRLEAAEALLDTDHRADALVCLCHTLESDRSTRRLDVAIRLIEATTGPYRNKAMEFLVDRVLHCKWGTLLEARALLETEYRDIALESLVRISTDCGVYDAILAAEQLLGTDYHEQGVQALAVHLQSQFSDNAIRAASALLKSPQRRLAMPPVLRLLTIGSKEDHCRCALYLSRAQLPEAAVKELSSSLAGLLGQAADKAVCDGPLYEAAWLHATLITRLRSPDTCMAGEVAYE